MKKVVKLYKYIKANDNVIWQQAPNSTYQLSCPSCSTRATQKSLTNVLSIFWREKSQEHGPLAEKGQDRNSQRTRQKSKTRDMKGESNDSHKIPDRGETDIPSLPLG